MALTRKSLKAMGIDEEKIEQIIEMHSETVEGLTGDMKRYKEDAEKLPSVQKRVAELEETSAQHAKDPYKVKYEGVKEEFDAVTTIYLAYAGVSSFLLFSPYLLAPSINVRIETLPKNGKICSGFPQWHKRRALPPPPHNI